MRHLQPLITAASTLLLLAPLRADEIHLTDGKILAEVEIAVEGLLKVEYRQGTKKLEVPSDQVLRILYSRKPPTVEAADAAVAEGNVVGAADDLQSYIAGVIDRPQRNFPWAPAYAMFRLVQVYDEGGNPAGVVTAARQLVQHAPESRYVPQAYLAMAHAHAKLGKEQAAKEALSELNALVQSKSLSQRWQLEAELAGALVDSSLNAEARRTRLKGVSSSAEGQFPTVRNRAEVAIGKTFVEAKDYAGALKVFEDIASDPLADDVTLAAAYTGLGESIFQLASANGDKSGLERALLALLRVGVLYPNDVEHAPKAIFFAGLVSDLIGTEESTERAQTLYRSLRRDYRESTWAEQARGAIQR